MPALEREARSLRSCGILTMEEVRTMERPRVLERARRRQGGSRVRSWIRVV